MNRKAAAHLERALSWRPAGSIEMLAHGKPAKFTAIKMSAFGKKSGR
jgi:hypothetical protein